MVKTVVFDLGKVLVDFDYAIAARNLATGAEKSAAEIYRVIYDSPLLIAYESARLTSRQFYDEARRATGFRGDFAEFSAAFADIFSEIPAMIRLQAELRTAGVPTFVLSNTNEIAVEHIRRSFPFFGGFTGLVLSYEHAVMKPEPAIYRAAESMSGCGGSEILFIDDRLENVEGAEKLGWRTVCHRSPGETIQLVRQMVS